MMTGHGAVQGFPAVTAADEKHQVIVYPAAHGMSQEHSTFIASIKSVEAILSIDLSTQIR